MKKIFLYVLLASVMSVSIAHANVYQQLSSGEMSQIKKAAQAITAGSENSQGNLDILAEILVTNYLDTELKKNEIDSLSWVCKALASTSNGRYRSLLIEVANSQAHKKLRKYAKLSYQKLPEGTEDVFIAGSIALNDLEDTEIKMAVAAGDIIPKAALTTKQRQLFYIGKGDLLSIKSIAYKAYDEGRMDPEIGDALAEYLLVKYNYAAVSEVDTLAWICKAFRSANQGRYKAVMEIIYHNTNNNKLESHAEEAMEYLSGADNSYQQGQVKLEELVNKFKAK